MSIETTDLSPPVRRLNARSGVTLIEVLLAAAIFSFVIAVSAQSMVSLVVGTRLQKDRVTAMHSCRVVLNAIREKKGEYRGANESDMVNWTNFFSWISTQNTAKWATYLTETDGSAALSNHTVSVELRKSDTGAVAVAGDNPLEVHVIASWKDVKGRTTSTRLVSRISDR